MSVGTLLDAAREPLFLLVPTALSDSTEPATAKLPL